MGVFRIYSTAIFMPEADYDAFFLINLLIKIIEKVEIFRSSDTLK